MKGLTLTGVFYLDDDDNDDVYNGGVYDIDDDDNDVDDNLSSWKSPGTCQAVGGWVVRLFWNQVLDPGTQTTKAHMVCMLLIIVIVIVIIMITRIFISISIATVALSEPETQTLHKLVTKVNTF